MNFGFLVRHSFSDGGCLLPFTFCLSSIRMPQVRIGRIAIALSCYLKKFHNFLTPFYIKTCSFHAPEKSRIFDTNMQHLRFI
jgi:hypothetical protein